jgi:hypothetical protein
MTTQLAVYERLMDSLLTVDLAERIVDLRADDQIQSRVDQLADKCNEGLLTPEERTEYEAYIGALEIISILQAKARSMLNHLRA